MASKASEDKTGNVRKFDPFIEALVSCNITYSQLDRAGFRAAKRTPIIAGSRKVLKEASNLYSLLFESMSLKRSVHHFRNYHYGVGDYIASEPIFSNGLLAWIELCSGEMKARKMREYIVVRNLSHVFNFRGSDDKVWDDLWADGTLDWFAWSERSLEEKTMDVADLLRYKGIISVNCTPMSKEIFPYSRILLGLPRAVVFSSLINPVERFSINQHANTLKNLVSILDDSNPIAVASTIDTFMENLHSLRKLLGPLFVEKKSGLMALKSKLPRTEDPRQKKIILSQMLDALKKYHLEFNLSSEQEKEIYILKRDYERLNTFDWGFFPDYFRR